MWTTSSGNFLGGFGSFEQGFPEDTLPETNIFASERIGRFIFLLNKANFQRDMLVSGSVPIDTIFWFGPWFVGKLFGGPCHWLGFFPLPVIVIRTKIHIHHLCFDDNDTF